MQAKILRVLEDGLINRIGGEKAIPANIRLIAATNKVLEQLVEEGSFRDDLFYRLNVITIEVPPLRNRTFSISII